MRGAMAPLFQFALRYVIQGYSNGTVPALVPAAKLNPAQPAMFDDR